MTLWQSSAQAMKGTRRNLPGWQMRMKMDMNGMNTNGFAPDRAERDREMEDARDAGLLLIASYSSHVHINHDQMMIMKTTLNKLVMLRRWDCFGQNYFVQCKNWQTAKINQEKCSQKRPKSGNNSSKGKIAKNFLKQSKVEGRAGKIAWQHPNCQKYGKLEV